MRRICKIFTVAIIAGAVVMGAFWPSTSVYANNITIAGDAAGALTIVSADQALFDIAGFLPGDNAVSSVTIRNDDLVNEGFTLSMYVESNQETNEETMYDLNEVINLRIMQGTLVLYDDLLAGVNTVVNRNAPVALGQIASGESVTLDFDLTLDGELADNHYQGLQSHFTVTFIANSYGPPQELTPQEPSQPDQPFAFRPVTLPRAAREVVSVVEPTLEEPDLVTIDEPDVPLAEYEPEAESEQLPYILIEDEEVPLAAMPETGEISLLVYLSVGFVLVCGGLWMIGKKVRRRGDA